MEKTTIEADYQQLAGQLALQRLQMNRLMEIMQAINDNYASEKLFEMYRRTLTLEMRVEQFAFFIYQDKAWSCATQENTPEELLAQCITANVFTHYTRITPLRDVEQPALRSFDYLIPIWHKKDPLACVLLRGLRADGGELYEQLRFINMIASIIAVALENKRLFNRQLAQERLKRDLELAVQVQNMLIPSRLPSNQHYEFAGIYQPHEGVGGDYYDLISFDDEEIAFCIADISGKGVAAALLMANFQANLHALIHRQQLHVKQFIAELNAAVLRTTQGDKFITFFIARYHPRQRRLRYLCAGHNPPFMLHKGKLTRLDKGCTILGAFSKIPKIEMGEAYLEEDAFLLLYTDGLTDLSNEEGDYFDGQRLEQFICDNQDCSVKEFNQRLMSTIARFKGDRDFPDDISVLTGRIFVGK